MYETGKCTLLAGTRISAAAKTAPVGASAGVMETLSITGLVPFGAAGISWTLSVEEISWITYKKLSKPA
jgi:hypothetical protein